MADRMGDCTGDRKGRPYRRVQLPCRQHTCCQTADAVEPVRPEGASLSPYGRVMHQEDASASLLYPIHWIGLFARRVGQTLTKILSLLFDFQRAKSRSRDSSLVLVMRGCLGWGSKVYPAQLRICRLQSRPAALALATASLRELTLNLAKILLR